MIEAPKWLIFAAYGNPYTYKVSLAPELISTPQNLSEHEDFSLFFIWSYKGIWNRRKYLELKKCADQLASELENFYINNDKAKYTPRAKEFIDHYIDYKFPSSSIDEQFIGQKAFKIFTQNHNFAEIKTLTSNFNQYDFSIALEQGADANFLHYGETVLMSAATRSEVVELLLENKAEVDAQNSFDKTALFYAIQFNNLESVKLLLAARAKFIVSEEAVQKWLLND